MMIVRGERYLVTGGTGFLASQLIPRLLGQGAIVRVMARNESKLIALTDSYPGIEIFPGDISDNCVVRQCMRDVSGVFHLAAFKHVRMAESSVRECVRSNVTGSTNILEASLDVPELKFVLGISTDKAARMVGVYGATKHIMEKLFLQFEEINPGIAYRIVRYGNVLYSSGSILCRWREYAESGKGEIVVTDPDSTRFYWTVNEAVDLMFECLSRSKDSRPYCPTGMKAMSLGDILQAFKEKYDPEDKLPVRTIGLQDGENVHELLRDDLPDSQHTEKFSIQEIMSKL